MALNTGLASTDAIQPLVYLHLDWKAFAGNGRSKNTTHPHRCLYPMTDYPTVLSHWLAVFVTVANYPTSTIIIKSYIIINASYYSDSIFLYLGLCFFFAINQFFYSLIQTAKLSSPLFQFTIPRITEDLDSISLREFLITKYISQEWDTKRKYLYAMRVLFDHVAVLRPPIIWHPDPGVQEVILLAGIVTDLHHNEYRIPRVHHHIPGVAVQSGHPIIVTLFNKNFLTKIVNQNIDKKHYFSKFL